jgi:SagB-type dehydrogenase family enzyme
MADATAHIRLPEPRTQGEHSVESLLARRRSARELDPSALTLAQIGQLAWAAQGISGPGGLRTAPSAGALYPLELYLAAGAVQGLEPGIYRYLPRGHALARVARGDVRSALARAALGQGWLARAPAVFVFGGVHERTAVKYGTRAARYVHMEAGHAGQNLFLQANALGLGSVVVGAFRDEEVSRVMGFAPAVKPLSLMPVGVPRGGPRP